MNDTIVFDEATYERLCNELVALPTLATRVREPQLAVFSNSVVVFADLLLGTLSGCCYFVSGGGHLGCRIPWVCAAQRDAHC